MTEVLGAPRSSRCGARCVPGWCRCGAICGAAVESDGVIGEPSPRHPEAKQASAAAAQFERCAALEPLEKHTAKLIEERQAILEWKLLDIAGESFLPRFKELEEEIARNEKILAG